MTSHTDNPTLPLNINSIPDNKITANGTSACCLFAAHSADDKLHFLRCADITTSWALSIAWRTVTMAESFESSDKEQSIFFAKLNFKLSRNKMSFSCEILSVVCWKSFADKNVQLKPQDCREWFMEASKVLIKFLFHYSYIPTRLWGFSGHVQTILQSLIGRVKCPWPLGERVYISLHDGSTLTYDLYQPLNQSHEEEITVAVCPGVGNSSESVYIRTFVHYAQCHGYRIAVLNHIGVIDTIQVTSPRIFTYGKFSSSAVARGLNFRIGLWLWKQIHLRELFHAALPVFRFVFFGFKFFTPEKVLWHKTVATKKVLR